MAGGPVEEPLQTASAVSFQQGSTVSDTPRVSAVARRCCSVSGCCQHVRPTVSGGHESDRRPRRPSVSHPEFRLGVRGFLLPRGTNSASRPFPVTRCELAARTTGG